MEAEEDYRRKERIVLAIIVVVASVAVASLLVAFSYYCYIRNKVSKRLKDLQGQPHSRFCSYHFPCIHILFASLGQLKKVDLGYFEGNVFWSILENCSHILLVSK